MYKSVIVEMRNHTQVENFFKRPKTKNQARSYGMWLAAKLTKWAACHDDEPFILWLGRDCNGKVFYESELLVND